MTRSLSRSPPRSPRPTPTTPRPSSTASPSMAWSTTGAASSAAREEIRGWSDREFIGAHVSLEVTEVIERDGDTVITAQVGGDGFNGPSHFTFRAAGDKLARMAIRE